MIQIISGLTGSGKTYMMTRLALKHSERVPEVPIYANYHFKDSVFAKQPHYFSSPKQLEDIQHAIVLIDDGAIWFNARNWREFSYEMQYKIINNRKDGLKIYITTQYMRGLDSVIRENCHYYYECKKVMGSDEYAKKVWGLIKASQYYPDLYDKVKRRPISTKYFLIRQKFVDTYDTYEKIERKPLTTKELSQEVKIERKESRRQKKLEKKRSKRQSYVKKK